MRDDLPYREAVAVDRMRVDIAKARKIASFKVSDSARERAQQAADLLTIAVELLEAPFNATSIR